MLPPKHPDKTTIDWNSIPENQRQLYMQQLRQNPQFQQQFSNNTQNPQQRPKKVPRKKSKTRDSSEDASFSEDELDPIEDIPSDAPRRSVRTRARSTYADEESDNEGNNQNAPAAPPVNKKGPLIEKILGKTVPQPGGQQVLCKLPGQAYSHCQYFSESQIQSNPDNAQILSKYKDTQEAQDSALSDVTPFISEPIFSRTLVDCFVIDHILDHRERGESNAAPTEAFDSTHYIPGYPFKQTPNFENILAYEKPLRVPDGFSNSVLDEYGVINLIGDDVIKADNNSDDEEDQHALIEMPSNPEYLIKWKGSNTPTWEDYSTLAGVGEELFRAANVEEFNHITDLYWSNLLKRKRSNKQTLENFDTFPTMERNIELTTKQKETINTIINSKNNKDSKITLHENGTGRIGTVLGFLHLIKHNQNQKVTALIIADKHLIPLYNAGLRVMTNLSYAEFKDEVESRSLVRQYQLMKDFGPTLDVLLISSDIFELEGTSLSVIKWNYMVIDTKGVPNTNNFITPFRIIISNRNYAESDFSYKEHAFFVTNAISGQIHDRLSKLMKLRNARSRILADPRQLYVEIAKSHIHPFLIGPMEDIIIQKFKMRFNIAVLSQDQHSDLFSSSSAKVTHLTDIIEPNKLTIVVADNHSMLRLLMNHLDRKNIKNAMIGSPIREESFPDRFNSGVILMIRDFSSPRLASINPHKIIFFDIGQNVLLDNALVRYFSRKARPEVYRMVTDNSLESVLYARFLTEPQFNYNTAPIDEMELYLRVEAITTQPNSAVSAMQSHDKIDFNVPGDPKCQELFGELVEKCRDNDFWDTVFSHRRVQDIRTVTWKRADAIKVLDYMEKKGFGDFERIAQEMGKAPDDVYIFARAVFLQFMTTIDKQTLVHYNLANAILWYEYYTAPFTDQFDDGSGFWQEQLADEPTLQTPVFSKPIFARQISQHMKSILDRIEEVWIVQTFLALHEEPYLPPRYFETPSHFLFEFLRAYQEHGTNYIELARRMSPFKVDKDIVAKICVPILNAITSDVLSIAMHAKETDFANDKNMKPILLACKNGPFSREWTNKEVSVVMQVAGNHYIPQQNGLNDWAEFRAIGRLMMKSQDMIQPFFIAFDDMLRKPKRPDDPVIISPELRNCSREVGPLPLAKNIVDNYRAITNQLKHIRTLATEGIKHFVKGVDTPEGWTIECDYALVTGVVQFGFQAREKLGRIAPHTTPNYFDIPMARSLSTFQPYLGQQGKSSRRLQFVILNNCSVKRRMNFFSHDIHKLEFVFPDYKKIAQEKMIAMQKTQQQIEKMREMNPEMFTIVQKTNPPKPKAVKMETPAPPPQRVAPPPPVPPPPPPRPPTPQGSENSIFGITTESFFAELQKSTQQQKNTWQQELPPPPPPVPPPPPIIPAQSMFAGAFGGLPPIPPPPPPLSPQQGSTASKIPAKMPPPPPPPPSPPQDNQPSIFGINGPIPEFPTFFQNQNQQNNDSNKKMVFIP